MAEATDVKQLLLQVDATTELLRRNLDKADGAVAAFEANTKRRLDGIDRNFEGLGKGLEGIRPAIDRVNANVGTIGVAAKRVEMQVAASSSAIRQSLIASAEGFAALFAANRVKELDDGYTRFTNQLKVAGVEGQNLGRTQEALFQIAQRYGVQLEGVGTLFGRAKQASGELGASQSQVLRFTEGVAAALKIQGGAPEESKGALLQLSQLLGTGVVRAEEFNSVNEGARPILQAVANGIDRYRGSVSALRQDVIAGKVTSQDFFQGFLRGSEQLKTQAANANLTIGASLTILNNALGRAIGQTDTQLSATARFAEGVKLLADNLDTVLPALVALGTGFAVVKGGQLAFDLLTAGVARAMQVDAELAAQVLRGNASFIDRAALQAKTAVAAEEAAVAEVSAIEATIAALREEAAQYEANLTLIARQRAEAQQSRIAAAEADALGFGRLGQGGNTRGGSQIAGGNALKAEIATKEALSGVNAQLATSEDALAAAQTRQAVAATESAAAVEATTFASRAATATAALFSGALTLVATAAPILIIGALTAAIIEFGRASDEAEANAKAIDERTRRLAESASTAAANAHAAAGGLNAVGSAAQANTGKVQAFAGAVGDAAEKLRALAAQRQKQAIQDAQDEVKKAQAEVDGAKGTAGQARTTSLLLTVGSPDEVGNDPYLKSAAKAQGDAERRLAQATANLAEERRRLAGEEKAPLESRITAADRTGSRDLKGELDRINVDLLAARRAGLKEQVNDLSAQAYERKRIIALMKQGESFEAASAQASKEAAKLRSAGEERISTDASRRAGRERATTARQAAAAAKKDAQDERAYEAASRQSLDELARAREDLATSAEERAAIERARVLADRDSKNLGIAKQGPAATGGTGTFSAQEVANLQALNNAAAEARVTAIDVAERRRHEQEANEAAIAGLQVQQAFLSDQRELATTAADRRAIELRILELQKQEEKLRLERVLAFDSGASGSERQQALIDYNTLDARTASKQAVVLNRTRGPLDGYAKSLSDEVGSAQAVKETLESIEVRGFSEMTDQLGSSVANALHLKGVVGEITADLVKMAAKWAILQGLKSIGLGGLAGGGKVDGFARGGLPGYAGGGQPGMISGPGSGTSDDILALVGGRKLIRVSNGESINTAESTKQNWPLIDAMNKGRLPRFAGGGIVSPSLSIARVSRADMAAVRDSRRPTGEVTHRVSIEPNENFDARVTSTATGVVLGAAPAIVETAKTRAVNYISRRNLPAGGTG